MVEGNLPTIQPPRRGDELHGLFATFRAASEALRTRQVRELEALEETLQLLEKGEGGLQKEAVLGLRTLAEQKRASLALPLVASPAELVAEETIARA
jgi:hypothetical protein